MHYRLVVRLITREQVETDGRKSYRSYSRTTMQHVKSVDDGHNLCAALNATSDATIQREAVLCVIVHTAYSGALVLPVTELDEIAQSIWDVNSKIAEGKNKHRGKLKEASSLKLATEE